VESDIENMSAGDIDQSNLNAINQEEWKKQLSAKKKTKRRVQLQATRQSSRLRGQGGQSIEEMATKRK
jgi:hypothetical protein